MKADKIKVNEISKDLDRRRKLTDADKLKIKSLHGSGHAIRQIAKIFEVNKRLIQFILFPERQLLNLEHRKDRGGSKQYYDKDKWRVTMQEHRDYKRKIYKEQL
ncbi:MAG: hypothetical protein KBD51_04010 [Candidatus Levybacteria bacterium]|nr:hypothetical protein [Candidatus Levybacteria bacterium]